LVVSLAHLPTSRIVAVKNNPNVSVFHHQVVDAAGMYIDVSVFGAPSIVKNYDELIEKYIKSKTKVVLWIVTPGLGGIVNDDGCSLKEIKFRVKLAENFKEASTSAEKTEVFLFVERRLASKYLLFFYYSGLFVSFLSILF
jgi:hypothetical protein